MKYLKAVALLALVTIQAKKLRNQQNDEDMVECEFLKVSPWGNFVPALNSLVSYACTTQLSDGSNVDTILFISAETSLTKESMIKLCEHMSLDDTLVVGAALPGHNYLGDGCGDEGKIVDLNGRTCPWNTLALWNLKKMN